MSTKKSSKIVISDNESTSEESENESSESSDNSEEDSEDNDDDENDDDNVDELVEDNDEEINSDEEKESENESDDSDKEEDIEDADNIEEEFQDDDADENDDDFDTSGFENEENADNVFEDSRKKNVNKKRSSNNKNKLFVFSQRTSKKRSETVRDNYNFLSDISYRNTIVNYFDNLLTDDDYESKVIEENIYQLCKRIIKDSDKSENFKTKYFEISRHVLGCLLVKNKNFLNELSSGNLYFWDSSIYQNQQEMEDKELDTIQNPIQVTENPDHPCRKCKSIKSFRTEKQLRGGDEGTSILFQCAECSYQWRING